MSNHHKLPTFVVLDVAAINQPYEALLPSLTLGMIPIDDGDVYRLLFEVLQHDEDIMMEVDALAVDILQELFRLNPYDIALDTSNVVRSMAHALYQQCHLHRLYHDDQLNYGYYRHAGGQLILKKHPFAAQSEAADVHHA